MIGQDTQGLSDREETDSGPKGLNDPSGRTKDFEEIAWIPF